MPLLCIFWASCCNSGGNSSDDNDTHENEDRAVGAPTELAYEHNRSNEIRLFWSAATNADFYQLEVENMLYASASTYYTLTDMSRYNAGETYTWKVRAGRKLAADTAYSAWVASTFVPPSSVLPPQTEDLPQKFKGIWYADSASVDVAMGASSLPVDSFIPDNLNISLLKIEVVEDESDENSALLSILGLNDFLSIEDQELNRIVMTPDAKTGALTGEVELTANNSVRTRHFEPPLLLSDLGIEVPPGIGVATLPSDIAIRSLTLAFNRVTVTGKLENEEATKAQYEIKVRAIVSVETTGEAWVDMIVNLYFSSNPLNVTLKVFCIKMQEGD